MRRVNSKATGKWIGKFVKARIGTFTAGSVTVQGRELTDRHYISVCERLRGRGEMRVQAVYY